MTSRGGGGKGRGGGAVRGAVRSFCIFADCCLFICSYIFFICYYLLARVSQSTSDWCVYLKFRDRKMAIYHFLSQPHIAEMIKQENPRFDKSPFVCNHCCILTQTISLWQTQLRIRYALPDSKGAEGAHINSISHTNHGFI